MRAPSWCLIMNSRKSRSNSAPAAAGEPGHFLGREHAGHQRGAGRMVRVRIRQRLAAAFQPVLHHLDLVGLRHLDPQRELPHVLAAAPGLQQRRHLQRLRVMADHPLHEPHVRRGVLDVRQIGRRRGADDAAGLAGCARLDDGRARRGRGRARTRRPPPRRRASARAGRAAVSGFARYIRIHRWPRLPGRATLTNQVSTAAVRTGLRNNDTDKDSRAVFEDPSCGVRPQASVYPTSQYVRTA